MNRRLMPNTICRRAWTLASLTSLAFLPLACGGKPKVEPATLVLNQGRIVTVEDQKPEAQALAARGDTIVAVGTNEEVLPYIGPQPRVLDLRGRLAIPGFIDGHGHFTGVGQARITLNLTKVKNWDEVAASFTIATTSSQFLTFVRFRVMRAWPTPVKWPWPSMKPGMASRPRRSRTRVWGPMYGKTSSFVPTATIVSPRAARACASGFWSSTVTIRPWFRTRVAGSTFGLPPQARGRKARLVSEARVHARRQIVFGISRLFIDPPPSRFSPFPS